MTSTSPRSFCRVWLSDKDAAKIGVKDNEWVEVYNRNGIVSARAIVSHRIPEGTMICRAGRRLPSMSSRPPCAFLLG